MTESKMNEPREIPNGVEYMTPELEQRAEEWREKISDMSEHCTNDQRADIYEENMAWAKEVEANNPNAAKYYMFHVLLGSTVGEDASVSYYDLEGVNSVEKYLEEHYGPLKEEPDSPDPAA